MRSVFNQNLLREGPVVAGGGSFLLLEDADEVGQVIEPAIVTDFGDTRGGVRQHAAGLGDAQVGDVLDKGGVGLLLEEVAEGRLGHVDQLCHVLQLHGFFIVCFEVFADFGDPPALRASDGVLGVILVAYQDAVVGHGQLMQDGEKRQDGVEALHACQLQDFVFHPQFGVVGEVYAFL